MRHHRSKRHCRLTRSDQTPADQILRGTKPAVIPVELPTRFFLSIKVKTAKALGLAVTPLHLMEADEVIE